MSRFNKTHDPGQSGPLGGLASEVETKERRALGEPAREAGADIAGRRWLAPIALVALVLLGVCTVQLWRIADRTRLDSGGADRATEAELPPLPPGSRGSSTKDLAREFDRMSERLTVELRGLNSQLSVLGGDMPGTFEALTRGVGQFGEASNSLTGIARSTQRLAAVQTSLEKMRGDLGQLDNVVANTDEMTAGMDQLNDQMNVFSSQLDSVDSSLGGLASIDSSMGEVRRELGQLNTQLTPGIEHMTSVLDTLCQALTGQDSCPE